MPLKRTPVKKLSSSFHLTPVVSTPRGLKKLEVSVKKVKLPQSTEYAPALLEAEQLSSEEPEDNLQKDNLVLKMATLEVLVHKRGMAKGKLTRMLSFLNSDEIMSAAMLKVYQRKIDAAYLEYHESHDKILQIVSPADRDEHDINFTVFDDLHMQILMLIEEKMEHLSLPMEAPGSNLQLVPSTGQLVVQNPLKIPLPSFDGKYENWSKFKVMFKDLVDKTADPPAVKLYHLDKALIGSASGIIDAKTINEGNYQHAWRLLEERYENLRHMVDTNIHGLFHLKRMTGEKCEELRMLVDECSRHVENLKFLKQEFTGVSEQFVINLLADALDKETRRHWEATIKHGTLPTYEATISFLKEQAFIMERCEQSSVKHKQPNPKKPAAKYSVQQSMVTTSATEPQSSCDVCGDDQHKSFKCPQLLAISVPQRLQKVREKNLCFNCLRKGHRGTNCQSTGSCVKCKKRHHSLLHADTQHSTSSVQPAKQQTSTTNQNSTPSTSGQKPEDLVPAVPAERSEVTTAACSSSQGQLTPHVLLMTAVVDVMDKHGNPHPCRILLDSASQVNIVTQRIVNLLQLEDYPANVSIVGVDGIKSRSNSSVTIQLLSRYVKFSLNVQCFVTQQVTADLPTSNVDVTSWEIPEGVQLADPTFDVPSSVDMLVGNQWFLHLLMSRKLQLINDGPLLCETKFGWVLGGAVRNCKQLEGVFRAQATTIEELSNSMQRFWEVEAVPQQFQQCTESEECEKHFLATHQRNASGRYVVELPLKAEASELGDSRSMALRRFFMLEKRFEQQPDLKVQYVEFIEEYERLGHCKEIYERDDPPELKKWYLPHHAVLRPSNTTTKCRVVFDASAKVAGRSLNDVMMIGGICQNELLAIVTAFRFPKFVLTADVKKMYRQIDVAECHTPLQRIFWRNNASDPLRVLQLTTVTYGTASAPFLATRALSQLAEDEKLRYPVAAEIVKNCFYVDNALFGFNDLGEAYHAQRQLIDMLECGGFQLHKWSANSEHLIKTIPDEDREQLVSIHESGINEVIKTLGLMWNPDSDELLYLSLPTSDVSHPTKRQVLSLISSMFDPLGLAAPIIIIGKILMQMLWKEGLDWDVPIEDELLTQWKAFLCALQCVDQLRVPRRVVADQAVAYEMHGFADASVLAYGACVYIRSLFEDGSASMKLLSAKSKVAPISPLSIPRKELAAALLLHRLVVKILQSIKMKFGKIVLWCDNQPVLAWLVRPPEQLELFVRNRVGEITSTGDQFEWKYVRSKDNPADIVSRGQSADSLAANDIWWNGPQFLRNVTYRMEIPPPLPVALIPELKPIAQVNVTLKFAQLPVITRFESFRKLQRVIAYVLRFVRNANMKKECRNFALLPTISELREAMKVIVRVIQNEHFADEIQRVASNEPCKTLRNLSPFLDEGILRVGGRLRNAILPYRMQHQWILPHKHPMVKNLINAVHRENLHIGPAGVIAILRQNFWITNCRNVVRMVTRSCVKCFRQKPRLAEQLMGDLPSSRVERAPAFSKVGIDFAGPLTIRQGIRKATPVKGYISVFICLVTKAIHLEAVEDLTTATFLAALQRFVARRGVPQLIWSDNGTNFIGARNELRQLYQLFKDQQMKRKIFEFCQPRQIQWSTIPPNAPHFGGLWEAGVKSVKSVLMKVFKQAALTIMEFATLLCQVEAILNSRPLFAHSDDPNDEEALTPGDFLVGRPLTAIPEPSCEEIPINRLSRWQHIQVLREHFWKRWSKEYIMELQGRVKWTRRCTNIQPGMMVIIREDNLPPQVWRLGRVVKVYPGDDGLVRVADVRTKGGQIQRPIHKLALLPISDNDTST